MENENARRRLLQERKRDEHNREYRDAVKHYVRKHAWVPVAQDRLTKLQEHDPDRKHLKYFTLCAKEAIDVHLFGIKNLVFHNGRGYPKVVFCENMGEDFAQIATSLGRARGFLAEFEKLVLFKGSEESDAFYDELPFDVLNLDFSGVCFPKSDPPYSRTLDAITTLISEMGQRFQHGFDLFLTFRAKRSEENKEAIKRLKANLRDNQSSYDWFGDAFRTSYQMSIGDLAIKRYYEFLILALPKFLGRFGKEAGFRVSCPKSLYYQRGRGGNSQFHIISFVLCFDWEGKGSLLPSDVRQNVPCDEITNNSYLDMLRHLVGQKPINVDTTKFARRLYKDEVATLLKPVDGFYNN